MKKRVKREKIVLGVHDSNGAVKISHGSSAQTFVERKFYFPNGDGKKFMALLGGLKDDGEIELIFKTEVKHERKDNSGLRHK